MKRAPMFTSRWDVARSSFPCDYHEGNVHRGAPVLFRRSGYGKRPLRACVPCAQRYLSFTPPASIVEQARALWAGPDGRAKQLPEEG